jgi:hypothetical protein
MNLAQRWFAELANRKLRGPRSAAFPNSKPASAKWINEWNKNPKPFVWTKTAGEILATFAIYCRRINDS